MSENKKAKQSAYEQQESRLSAQSVAFIKLLTQRGILGDTEIDDDKIRQAQKEKKRHTYHNTEMLLQHYRDIVWALECFPSTIVRKYRSSGGIPLEFYGQGWDDYCIGRAFRFRQKYNGQPDPPFL